MNKKEKMLIGLGFVPLILCLLLPLFGDRFNTRLKRKTSELHGGMSFAEVTNFLSGFEVAMMTNYPAPFRSALTSRSNYDNVTKIFSGNLMASSFSVLGDKTFLDWGFRDYCMVNFDTNGIIRDYHWLQMH